MRLLRKAAYNIDGTLWMSVISIAWCCAKDDLGDTEK